MKIIIFLFGWVLCVMRFVVARASGKVAPLSAFLFVLCTDALLGFIMHQLKGESILRACADDIAIVFWAFWVEAPCVSRAFRFIEEAMCPALNKSTCILIPLWVSSADEVKALLGVNVPLWDGFKVDSKGKYLGLVIGPGSKDESWRQVMENT